MQDEYFYTLVSLLSDEAGTSSSVGTVFLKLSCLDFVMIDGLISIFTHYTLTASSLFCRVML